MSTDALHALLDAVGVERPSSNAVAITGSDPVLQTRYRIGEGAATVLAAIGVAVSNIWELGAGCKQKVAVDVTAAAASLLSFAYLRLENGDQIPPRAPRITDLYPTKNGRWFLLHGSFPNTTEATLKLLDCSNDKVEVAKAISAWEAQQLEDEMGERGLCGAMVRSAKEWGAHPQGQALASRPVVEVLRVGDCPAQLIGAGKRPLSGVRVLDLTRVLAGPTCGRTLAEHGADVLRIDSPKLPNVAPFVIDTGHGKHSAHLDLTNADDAERLRGLVREADMFTQGYRLGAMERLGFGPEALHELRPGLIYTSLNCYGHEGPWKGRPGWEQLAQTVTGIAAEHGGPKGPRLLPAAATDYTTGFLAALGALAALRRRAEEGGSYHVRVSLARTGMWLDTLGRSREEGAGLTPDDIAPLTTVTETPHGRLQHLKPSLQLSETPPHWELPTVPLGTHDAAWW